MKLLSLASLAVVLLQAPLSPLQQQRPSGSIEGLVTRSGSSQPVSSARVTLTRRGGPPASGPPAPAGARGGVPMPLIPPVVTDDKGRFAFPGLDEGTYTLQVQANGYVVQPYGQRFPNGPGTPIVLSGGQAMKDANVNLIPAANVSGRVRDTSDQPLVNVPVQLLRYSYDFNGQRTYQSVGATVTNDRGEYRMYWVTPGRYYLLAGRPTTGANPISALLMMDANGANGNEVPAVLGYAFYPGVTEIANARSIDLQPGADAQAIDLALTPKPRTYAIRGKVIDSRTGQPPARANVLVATQTPGLSAAGTDSFFGSEGASQNYNAKTGALEIRELLPGTYSLIALVQDPPVAGRGGPPSQATGMIPVTISASDIEGITISVIPAVSISGRLRIDGQLQAPMTIERFRVSLAPVGASSAAQSMQEILASTFYQSPQAQVGTDGTFRLNNIVPGDYRVNVSGFSGNVAGGGAVAVGGAVISTTGAGGFLKEARFEGADVLNSPMRFSGVSNSGLDVVLGLGGGRVEGAVSDVRSQAVSGTRVVIVPDRARYRSDLYRTAITNENGRFVLSSLPPGDYKVFSWESLEDNAWFDPEVLSRFEPRGRAVHVTETSSETIDVRIIPAEGPR